VALTSVESKKEWGQEPKGPENWVIRGSYSVQDLEVRRQERQKNGIGGKTKCLETNLQAFTSEAKTKSKTRGYFLTRTKIKYGHEEVLPCRNVLVIILAVFLRWPKNKGGINTHGGMGRWGEISGV